MPSCAIFRLKRPVEGRALTDTCNMGFEHPVQKHESRWIVVSGDFRGKGLWAAEEGLKPLLAEGWKVVFGNVEGELL